MKQCKKVVNDQKDLINDYVGQINKLEFINTQTQSQLRLQKELNSRTEALLKVNIEELTNSKAWSDTLQTNINNVRKAINEDVERKDKHAKEALISEYSGMELKLKELSTIFKEMESECSMKDLAYTNINQLVDRSVNPQKLDKGIQVNEVDLDWGVQNINEAKAFFPSFSNDPVFGRINNIISPDKTYNPMFDNNMRVMTLFGVKVETQDTLDPKKAR